MRIQFSLVFGACLIAAAGSVFGQGTTPTGDLAGRNDPSLVYTVKQSEGDGDYSTKATRRAVSPSDEKFMIDAAMLNNAEISMGRLVLERSANSNVKSFADAIVISRSNANQELARIAERLGLSMPATLAPNHQAVISGMRDLSGDDFDRAYVKQQLGDHAVTIDMYKAANKSKQKDLKTFAKGRISAIEEDFSTLKSLDNRMTPVMLVIAAPNP